MIGFSLTAFQLHELLQVAIKFLPRDPRAINVCVQRELHNHSRFRHPNVARFKRVFLTSTHLCLVMEYAAGGTLHERINARRLPVALSILIRRVY
jgi:serine/threonine-protein kinase SRK2